MGTEDLNQDEVAGDNEQACMNDSQVSDGGRISTWPASFRFGKYGGTGTAFSSLPPVHPKGPLKGCVASATLLGSTVKIVCKMNVT